MFSKWLSNISLKARGKMLLQELTWELEAADEVFRARVLILASLIRSDFMDSNPWMNPIIDNPFAQTKGDLTEFYNAVEDARNQTKRKHRQQHQMIKGLGSPEELSFFDKEQTNAGERALEVWMATAATPLVKNGFEYGKRIWKMLSVSEEVILKAEDRMRELEKLSEPGALGLPESEQILEACRYVPSAFR